MNINPISQALIVQADNYNGYSSDNLLVDLLATKIRLVTYTEAAKIFSLKPKSISEWAASGRIPKYGVYRNARINIYDIYAYYLANKTQARCD